MKYLYKLIFALTLWVSFSEGVKAQTLLHQIPITEDTYTESIFFDESHGFKSSLLIGYANSTREGITRSYLKYNPNSLSDEIRSSVVSAKLKLYQYKVNNTSPYTVKVGIVHHTWSEDSLMWNTSNMGLIEEIKEVEFPSTIGWVEVEITDILKRHITEETSNNGLVIYMQIEALQGGAFWSKDCITFGSSCNITQLPHVKLEYENVVPTPPPNIDHVYDYILEDSRVNLIWEGENIEGKEVKVTVEKAGILIQEGITLQNHFTTSPLFPGTYKISLSIEGQTIEREVVISEVEKQVIPNEKFSTNVINQLTEVMKEVGSSMKKDETEPPALPDSTPTTEVLGISRDVSNQKGIDRFLCSIRIIGKRVERDCRTPSISTPTISVKYSSNTGTYIKGSISIPLSLEMNIEWIGCKKLPIQLTCITTLEKRRKVVLDLKYPSVFIKIDGKWYQTFTKINGDSLIFDANLSFKPKNNQYQLRYIVNEAVKVEGKWIDIYSLSPITPISSFKIIETAKPPYTFPLNRIVNVTQWHGKTAYSSNHTGIDFEATRIPITAITDGIVEFAGWDSYGGKCHSGGNYVKVKHNDGKYSTYLHMNSFAKGIKKGTKVKKGQVLGISGDTGSYNCEKLAHHLHFEVRKNSKQVSHINSVPLIDVDWSKIKTAKADRYPGRLQGDNPHPTY